MPKRPKKRARQVNLELDDALADALDEYVRERGSTRIREVSRAIRRHLANPEPLPEPPADQPLSPILVSPPEK